MVKVRCEGESGMLESGDGDICIFGKEDLGGRRSFLSLFLLFFKLTMENHCNNMDRYIKKRKCSHKYQTRLE